MQLTHTPAEKRDNDLIEKKREKFKIFSKTLNDHLQGKEYICGDHFSAADCVVNNSCYFFVLMFLINRNNFLTKQIGYNVWWASIINKGELLEDYPDIRAYKERMCSRDAWKKVFCRATKPSGGSI